mmetsp:Transcript_21595/g.47410  ORF Transcript_21595/g.47410 Transcript_21595/m.47410 type:complete len:214 (+) Transcript_21595:719-1360(+)
MAAEGPETAKGERRLDSARVPNLEHAVEAGLERAVAVGGEEAEEDPQRLQLLQLHPLVAGHRVPVLLQQLSQRGPVRLRVDVREHVGRAVCRAGSRRERLPEDLPVVRDRLARVDDVAGRVVLEPPADRPHREAHPIRLVPVSQLPHHWTDVAHAIQHQLHAHCAGALRALQRQLRTVWVHGDRRQASLLQQRASVREEALLGLLNQDVRADP